jgi:hypothetical protein
LTESNIRVLSDDDHKSLLPILADVGRIVNWNRFEDGELPRLSPDGLQLIGERRPAKSRPNGAGRTWTWSW